jgi:DNA (cytosine-5)-methyltransferase 1
MDAGMSADLEQAWRELDTAERAIPDPGRPRLLDLFCCEGGAGTGYRRAGFKALVGVDLVPQPRYPFEFVRADAIEAMDYLLTGGDVAGYRLGDFDAIHASPPCQDYSKAMRHLTSGYPRLIGPVRQRLEASGLPWVIENVPGSGLPAQDTLDGDYGVELCGTMFGRPFRYHRLFGTSFAVSAPRGCDHSIKTLNPRYGSGPGRDTEAAWRGAIGVPWASQQGGREAVPVVYTEYIGAALLRQFRLFGSQMVHLGCRGTCLMCGVLLSMAEVYDDCGACPGFVEPVPPWALLGGSGTPAGQLPLVAAKEAA